jgi:hypothetical protein
MIIHAFVRTFVRTFVHTLVCTSGLFENFFLRASEFNHLISCSHMEDTEEDTDKATIELGDNEPNT